MKKEIIEKRNKARAESRPKKLMDILGWEIRVDERNYIITKENRTYYFSNLENALWDISQEEEKGKVRNLETMVKDIKRIKEDFLKALSTAVDSI